MVFLYSCGRNPGHRNRPRRRYGPTPDDASQKKKKDFINTQQIENIQDLNLEYLFSKAVILQKEKIIKKKKYYPVVQVYQIIKVGYRDLNQTKEF